MADILSRTGQALPGMIPQASIPRPSRYRTPQVSTLQPIVQDAADFSLRSPGPIPEQVRQFPQLRFMGSKYRLLSWIHGNLSNLDFDTALDAFSGSGCVSYLLKAMGKQTTSNDFLNFSATVSRGIVENSNEHLEREDVEFLLSYDPRHRRFIERTFSGIFYAPDDLRFLDRVLWNLQGVESSGKKALAISALVRSCVKRQPRGVFTVAGDPERYKDGRRDLRLSIREHFIEQVQVYNKAVFANGRANKAHHGDIFETAPHRYDLVYMDPPYVPRADDNCYMKRYHFLEGLSCYWNGMEILPDSKVRKTRKPYTPFSYPTHLRRSICRAVLGGLPPPLWCEFHYSSNGYPELDTLVGEMRRFKGEVEVFERSHRYHFGTHNRARRNSVTEYLIVGGSSGT